MENIYYDISHPAGFGGINRLHVSTKQPKTRVKRYLDSQPVYRTFKVPKKKFKRAKTIVPSIAVQFQADLFDLQKLSSHNSNYKWILVVVDTFSRYIKCQPLKNKTGEETARGLDKIFGEYKTENKLAPYSAFGTDGGNEFYNKFANLIYKKYNVAHFLLRGPIKCSFAEISGRYIVERLHKYMMYKKTKRWVDALPLAVQATNKRKNKKTANLAPIEIDYSNQNIVFKALYPRGGQPGPFTLDVGDRVQVVKDRLPFFKSYRGHYSSKWYRISKRHPHTVPRYSLIDEEDEEPISGTYYANELYKEERPHKM